MFMLRNTQRAAKRGYAVAASAVSLEVNADTGAAVHYARQLGQGGRRRGAGRRELDPGEYRRDGRILSDAAGMAVLADADQRDDDGVEGELSPAATLIEHEAEAVIEAIEPSRPSPPTPTPRPHRACCGFPSRQGGCLRRRSALARRRRSWGVEVDRAFSTRSIRLLPAAVRYERDRIDAWDRNHLVVLSERRSAVSCCRRPIIAGEQVDRNIERRGTRALPSGLLRCVARRAESGGAAGAGARGLNLSETKSRDVCAAPTLPVWPGPPAAAVGRVSVSAICAATAGCARTPSTMIAAGKTVDRAAGSELSNND